MESIDSADLLELVLLHREALSSQTQFWLTSSFAVIVASFVAGPRLTGRYRIFIGLLYLLVTVYVFGGLVIVSRELVPIFEELQSRGISAQIPIIAASSRVLLLLFGTFLTLVFLYQDQKRSGKGDA